MLHDATLMVKRLQHSLQHYFCILHAFDKDFRFSNILFLIFIYKVVRFLDIFKYTLDRIQLVKTRNIEKTSMSYLWLFDWEFVSFQNGFFTSVSSSYTYPRSETIVESTPLPLTAAVLKSAYTSSIKKSSPVLSTPKVRSTTSVSLGVVASSWIPEHSISSIPPTTSVQRKTDGCKTYQVLSDKTRAVTYTGLNYQPCDNKLYGWYRFTGDAGNRMLDYCPLSMSGPRYNRCGTSMQGWIMSGSMPMGYEGEVSRMVCFSGSSSCSCRYQKQIKVRNCGTFYVYWLDGVANCNLRYCSVKGKGVIRLLTKHHL